MVKVLQLHCDRASYEPVKKEIEYADEAEPHPVELLEVVVVFVAVENGDSEKTATVATAAIRESMSKLGCSRILLYPYAHLSSDLAPPQKARKIIDAMATGVSNLELHRAPFGWTKSYTVKVKGHPLAESHMSFSGSESDALAHEKKIESEWFVLEPDGDMISVSEYDFVGKEKLQALVRHEQSRVRSVSEPPPHVGLMKRLGVADYEPASDRGNMRFYPNGRLIKSLIEEYVTSRVRQYGGYEVETPIMYDSDHPSMRSYFDRFPARQYSVDSDGKSLFLRFAACFGQFLMARDMQMSHKNLPYRLYELTRYSFRREQSGELVGLRRLRAFTMPDCHAFCSGMEQALTEMLTRFDLSRSVVSKIGIPEKSYEMAVRVTRQFYKENQKVVKELVMRHGRPVLVEMWPERFFYFVLKWEFNYVDDSGKASALSTDQIDIENGNRYGIEFIDSSGKAVHPLVLHNSPSGAIERVMYTLLEEAASKARRGGKPTLPVWLCPTQVRLIPLNSDYNTECIKICGSLESVRADIDDRPESVGKRVREAEREWIPYIAVVGPKESESKILEVRDRLGGERLQVSAAELVSKVLALTEGMPFAPLNGPRSVADRPQVMV